LVYYFLSDIFFWSNFNYIYPTISGCYIYNTGSTQAKEKSRKWTQLSQRGPRNAGIAQRVLKIEVARKRSEKYFEPPFIAKRFFGTFFQKKHRPPLPHPLYILLKNAYKKIS
jgi:hypothetical protein